MRIATVAVGSALLKYLPRCVPRQLRLRCGVEIRFTPTQLTVSQPRRCADTALFPKRPAEQ